MSEGGESGGEGIAPSGESGGDIGVSADLGGGVAKMQEHIAPDGVPSKFFDITTGDIDHASWGKSTKELEGKLRTKSEEMRQSIEDEYMQEIIAGRPETPDDYELKVPDSVQMPEGMEFTFNENDNSLKEWRNMVHEMGGDQEMFEKGLSMYINSQIGAIPDFDTELAALGESGPERANAVNMWAKANLSEDTYSALEQFAVTAKGLEALEEIMTKTGEPAFSPANFDNTGASGDTLADLQAKQADPRYWDVNKRDARFVREVDAGFEKLFGG